MPDDPWESALTATSAEDIFIRGYDLTELIGRTDFASVLYLLYTGELPSPSQSRLIDALMVASIDHGPGTPSAQAARVAISGGATVPAAAAAGLLAMGEHHGAAVEDSMRMIEVVATAKSDGERALSDAADEVVAQSRAAGKRAPGFGHREHKKGDPRVERLFELAVEAGLPTEHVDAARAIEAALKRVTGNEVPINIDGAMAAILGDLGFPAELSNALFISARMVGVLRHAVEEKGMQPMRRIDPDNHRYTGPAPRSLPRDGSS